MRHSVEAEDASVVLTDYKVTVHTGNRVGAGTDADVYITLFGSDGQCGESELNSGWWHNDFETGEYASFHLLNIQLLSNHPFKGHCVL